VYRPGAVFTVLVVIEKKGKNLHTHTTTIYISTYCIIAVYAND
jgi:hypothetical protein